MSSIGPDNRLNVAGLDRLDRQVSLDDLRRQPGTDAQAVSDAAPAATADAQATDAGEDILNAGAWDGIDAGTRTFDGDLALEGQLGALDLGQAADSAVDAVLGSFA